MPLLVRSLRRRPLWAVLAVAAVSWTAAGSLVGASVEPAGAPDPAVDPSADPAVGPEVLDGFLGVPGIDLAALGYEGPDLFVLDDVLLAGPDLPADPVGRATTGAAWIVEARTVHDGLVEAVAVLEAEVTRLGPVVATAEAAAGSALARAERAEDAVVRAESAIEDREAALEHRRRLLAEAAVAAYVRPPGMDSMGAVLRGETTDEVAAAELFESRIDNDLVVEAQLEVELAMLAERLPGLLDERDRARAARARAEAARAEAAGVLAAHEEAVAVGTAQAESLGVGLFLVQGAVDEVLDEAIAAVGGPEAGRNRPDVPLVTVEGITVHAAIAPRLQSLLADARADGVELTGWGHRSHQRQIELRIAHCGPTDVEIWLTPPSQCRPPTAVPGTSQHEVGLAVDFAGITSRSQPAFVWLAEHAAAYGLFNLPSEPWHWSVDGR